MEAALQVVVSGLLVGVEYALAAIGMTMIFGVSRVLNLAHGAFFALGAYLAYQTSLAGLPSFAGAVPAAAAGVLLGAAVERALVRPVRGAPFTAAVVLLGLAFLAEGGFRLVWGASLHSVPIHLVPFLVGRIVVNTEQMVAAAIAIALVGAMALFCLRTRPGLALRAAAADPEITALAGVDIGRVRAATFAGACGMAAVAGAFLSPLLPLSPAMGRGPLLLSLAMVIGGAGRISGTLAASLVIGLASTIVGFYFAPAWSYVLASALVGAVIIWRADGALGGRTP